MNQPQSSSRNNTNDGSFTPKLSAILGSFLEVLIHEILYTRSLYPHDAFSPTRHYGVLCHACRHSGVVDYIYDTLKVAIPAIIAGIVKGLYLVFYDEDTDEIYERFALEFQLEDFVEIQSESLKQPYGSNATHSNSTNSMDPSTLERHAVHHKIKQLESNLRDVLLRISSLHGTDLGRRRGRSTFSSSTTFKLCLKKVEIGEGREGQEVCPPELVDALQNGKWFSPDSDVCQFSSSNNSFEKPSAKMSACNHADPLENRENECSHKGSGTVMTRPLKSVDIPSCGLSLQMLYEFET